MNETLKKFSDALKKDFEQALVKNPTSELVSKIKAANDAVDFSVIISTSDEDRQGDSLDQSKWNLDNFKANPVVLWAHDYYEPPIGICTSIAVKDGQLVAEGRFAPAEINPFAAQIAAMYQAGFIKATSVGFMIHESGELELLEFSFVPVPANPFALSMRQLKKLQLNTSELVMKGIRLTVKAEQIGDRCEMDDGTPGILADDENNPGALVCVPAEGKSKSNETQEDMNNELVKNLKAEHGRHGQEVANAVVDYEGKSIEEFRKAVNAENETHFDKCMKAVNEGYTLSDNEKGVANFKAAIMGENYKHAEEVNKTIGEFDKNIDEFTSTIKAELERHEDAHMDLCKAEFGEGQEDGKSAKKAEELPVVEPPVVEAPVVEPPKTEPEQPIVPEPEQKSGRQISAKNKSKIEAVMKSIDEYKAQHTADHEQFSNNVIAALKDLTGPEGNEGEEPKDDKKSPEAPKNKVEVRATRPTNETFEAFMAARQVLRTVDSAVGEALKDLNLKFRENFPNRR